MTIALNVDGDDYNKVYKFNIEGAPYYFHVYYNTRSEGWQVVIYDTENNPTTTNKSEIQVLIDCGKMMPNGACVWRYSKSGGLFNGELVCVNMQGKSPSKLEPVTKYNFGEGREYQLVYFTEDEIVDFDLASWTTYRG